MATCFSALLILSFLFCSLADAKAVENLDISINTTDGSYQILLSNKLWFNSGPVAIRYKGECLASENSSLSLLNHSVFSGEDAWGQFTSTELWWQSADKTFNYVTYINQYNDLPILGFVQGFDDGTSDASTGSTDGIISSFPTLLVEDLGLERAFMTYSGGFASDVHVHEWSSDETIPGGYDGGVPLVVFDSALENTVVISPANTFMSASQASWSPKNSKSPAVGFGITGSVSYVPKLYIYKTVLVAGQNVTGTMLYWGHLLRKLYGKEDDTYRKSDFSINYLGYWTDNGACYYYNTANYSNYEDALVAVKKRADEQEIPFRYLQIDSWWYFKGTGNGVKNWTAMPSVFPNGIDAVVQKTGWPVMAHNRYWSADTDYAKHNGGDFNFIIDGNLALPNDSNFWYYLLSSSKLQWDLFVDNGACYYYNTANYSNYEDALVAVKKRADEQEIPFRYLQIDSWWYFKGTGNGVKNWTAMPSVFPNGIDAVVQKTGWPVMAHNRYWSADTDYAKHNGGDFNFIIDGNLALPNDSNFWYYLLSSSKLQWDLFVYEQDWLLTVARGFHPVQKDLFLGRDWLMQMGTAAEELGMTIQYCMPWTRHLLQSVEIPVVTQTRASGDYQPQNTQWMIGDTTILAHALGLAAFKDDFHTTPQEDGCKFTKSEAYPELETYMAALSAGPVGPSDTADGANKMLIMATCMSDGRLLKPSHPVMSVDSSFVYRAFKKDGPSGQLYAGYTEVTGWTWYHILAAEMTEKYELVAAALPPSHSLFPKSEFPSSIAFRHDLTGKVVEVVEFSSSSSIMINTCGRSDFQYWTIAPTLEGTGMALLGELNKIVTVSETRFQSISKFGSDCVISLVGAPGEKVEVSVYDTGEKTAKVVTCNMSSSGTATLHVPQLWCSY